jgi:hypothetical protein
MTPYKLPVQFNSDEFWDEREREDREDRKKFFDLMKKKWKLEAAIMETCHGTGQGMRNVLSSDALCQQATKPVEIPPKKKRKREKQWLCRWDWHAERPTSEGDQILEARIGRSVLGKKMWVDPSRIPNGNYVWARVKDAGEKGDVWPEATWHTPNGAIRDTPGKRSRENIKIFSGGHTAPHITLWEWLNSLKTEIHNC